MVLVILAILAALLVPALTGYIDKAKEKKIVSETRMVVMAVQTVASETYGSLNNLDDDDPTEWATIPTIGGNLGKEGIRITEIKKLAEVFDSNPKATFYAEIYWDAHIKTVQYDNGAYTPILQTAREAARGAIKSKRAAQLCIIMFIFMPNPSQPLKPAPSSPPPLPGGGIFLCQSLLPQFLRGGGGFSFAFKGVLCYNAL